MHETDTDRVTPQAASTQDDEELSLLDALVFVADHFKAMVILPLLFGVAVLGMSFLLPNSYKGEVKLMPPQQSPSSAAALLGQLGGVLGGTIGQGLGLSLKNPSEIYVSILKSRTVADTLITRFDLLKVYEVKYLKDARRILDQRSAISAGKDGIINIEVEDHDRERAAALANAYAEELDNLSGHLAISKAAQSRLFFETQLQKTKQDLAAAETALRKFEEQHGLIVPAGQAALAVSSAATLRAQITEREVMLASLRSFATEHNPDIQRIRNEIQGLKAEMAKQQKDEPLGAGDIALSLAKAPQMSIEYLRHVRELKYQEVLFELFARQYESARIDEAKDATIVQVLDKALPPEKKSGPKRGFIAIGATVFASVVCTLWLLARNGYRRGLEDPHKAPSYRRLREFFSFRKRTGSAKSNLPA